MRPKLIFLISNPIPDCSPLKGRLLFLVLILTADFAYAQKNDSTAYKPSKRPNVIPIDRHGDPFSNPVDTSPLQLTNPTQLDIEIDTGMNYTIYERIGGLHYRPVSEMSFSEFKQFQEREQLSSYWRSKMKAQDGESAVSGRGLFPKIAISPVLDRIFGGSYIELVPRGFVQLDFGAAFQRINNPSIPIRQQRSGGFEFDQQINLSVTGKIGEKLAVTTNFDNNNSFDFQNNMKVEYTGFKEDILQKLEIGNVSLPLNNTLIQGAQNLFGVKAQLQFGKLKATSIATTQRGKASSIKIDGKSNGQNRPFEIIASNYDENRHFFLGHFFREHYEQWIANTPQIISGVNITRVEVYVLNRKNDTQSLRNIVGLMDLGEGRTIYNTAVSSNGTNISTSNGANNLFASVTAMNRSADEIGTSLETFFNGTDNNGTDFEKINAARKLNSTEYTLNSQLGYITLTTKLQNDEALAVSFEYTYNGKVFKVGELSEDYSSLSDDAVIFLKLLRPRKIAIRDASDKTIPTWELMMKNIYSLGATQLQSSGFQLRVIYRDDASGIDNPQLQEGNEVRSRQLIEILGLDNLNTQNDRQKDGNFDFVEGLTIHSANGLIIFPYLKPFSSALRKAFSGESSESYLIQKYAYDTLYGTTRSDATLFASKNKFYLKGLYTASSTNEILIPGFTLAQGSVKVYVGGIALNEGTDFVVDYTFGKVTILNESVLSSGNDIEVQYEQSDSFSFQSKSLLGTRLDYQLNENLNLGSTLLYYNERPAVTRNTVGNEPARNIQYGVDFNYNKKSRMLTKLLDAFPLLSTKEESSVNFTGEFAQLIPGTSNIVDGEGTGYIDDFENTSTPYSMMGAGGWKLAAVPRSTGFELDPSSGAINDIRAGYKRAKLAWYAIDNQLQRDGGTLRPSNISDADLDNHYVRGIGPQEIFPNKQLTQGVYFEDIFNISYFPSERGPYNYQQSLTSDGLLPNPKDNWGGITTPIKTETDFDKANIEYIEFWLLDPFLNLPSGNGKVLDGIYNKSNDTGGRLVFQLGTISEDIIRDSKHAFENGLPANGDLVTGNVSRDNWGYVTTDQYLTNSFDNNSSSRQHQDVGFDGMGDETETTFFSDYLNSLNPSARAKIEADPSADNFRYFLDGQYDLENAKILQRYKDYNGQDGNSPISTGGISYSSYLTPDNEDLNTDNTLNESEEYYQYDINLQPGQLKIDAEYIVDKITTTETNSLNEPVTWYLFRIPIREYESSYGNIDGFKSIKYIRMLLTGFQEPVVLRMANFRMVSSYWRRYTEDLRSAALTVDTEPDLNNFTVSVVNLEENAVTDVGANKSGYVIPPGVVRDRDNTSSVSRLLNEQSIQVCVDDLVDGDARAVYKNLSMDLFNYGRIKMFLHANSTSADNSLSAFLRLGTDFDANYYEIEIPLKVSNTSDASQRGVWPEENEIDLLLSELYTLKASRDLENFSLTELYPQAGPKEVGRHRLRIIGRPDLSSLLAMMIGIRNPKSSDKQAHSACVWANELRVTDFDRTAGWAVNSTATIKLADFATFNGAIRHTTYGFGSISSGISERTREETTAYDLSGSINLDKLLPENSGMKIPMFVSYQNSVATPFYDPANPDMKLSAALQAFTNETDKQNYLNIIKSVNTRRSINFMNVRKVKTNPDARSKLWDIENFSLSYSYSDGSERTFTIAETASKQYKGSVAYVYNSKTKGFEPFMNSSLFTSPWLKIIRDFNVNLLPASIGVRADLDRSITKTVYRNSLGNGTFSESDPAYLKYFTFNRQYNVRWNLSKNLNLEYASKADAVVDEPYGELDTQEKKDSVLNNLKNLGRMKNFNQSITGDYKLPLDKFPATDWMGAQYRYQATYTWLAGTYNQPDSLVTTSDNDLADSLDFKNTISNTRVQNMTGTLDMVKLYNKIKFLKQINATPGTKQKVATNKRLPTQLKADTVKSKSFKTPVPAARFLRLLMMLRSVNATYVRTEGTTLPGFTATPRLFGMDREWQSPGWGFVLGSQNPDVRYDAAEQGLLTTNTSLTSMFTQSRNESINVRANLEPLPTVKVQLDLKKESSNAYEEIFRFDPDQTNAGPTGFTSLSPNRSGSYTISFMSFRTAFDRTNGEIESNVFKKFESNLIAIQNRFRSINGSEHDTTSQDIIIPAFIAAYSGRDVNSIGLSPFAKKPKPNWRIDFTGLGNIPRLKEIFQSITVSHAYQSTYSVTNYSSSLSYDNVEQLQINNPIESYNSNYFSESIDGVQVPVYVIGNVSIVEQFAPLFGINVRTKSRLTANVQYKTRREVSLTVSNAQITESLAKDVAVEFGYTKTNLRLPLKVQGRAVVLKNDITFRMNVTINDSRVVQRKINDTNTLTNGNISVQIRPTINYVLNQKLSLQFYFTRTVNEPLVSSSYRRTTTNAGLQVRFNLAQ